MPINMNVVCDFPGCDQAQSVGFDAPGETFGDLLSALEGGPWTVRNRRSPQKDVRVYCDVHPSEDVGDG